jgi:hypothetical protein
MWRLSVAVHAHGYRAAMKSGVSFSWRALAAAAVAPLRALALQVVSYQEPVDSLGLAFQYAVAALAVLVVASIGYVVGRPWVLLVPWAGAAAWLVVGVVVEVARRSDE